MARPELLEQIYTIVDQIPPGRVTTYGRIAAMTEGAPNASTANYAMRGCCSMPKDECPRTLFGLINRLRHF